MSKSVVICGNEKYWDRLQSYLRNLEKFKYIEWIRIRSSDEYFELDSSLISGLFISSSKFLNKKNHFDSSTFLFVGEDKEDMFNPWFSLKELEKSIENFLFKNRVGVNKQNLFLYSYKDNVDIIFKEFIDKYKFSKDIKICFLFLDVFIDTQKIRTLIKNSICKNFKLDEENILSNKKYSLLDYFIESQTTEYIVGENFKITLLETNDIYEEFILDNKNILETISYLSKKYDDINIFCPIENNISIHIISEIADNAYLLTKNTQYKSKFYDIYNICFLKSQKDISSLSDYE